MRLFIKLVFACYALLLLVSPALATSTDNTLANTSIDATTINQTLRDDPDFRILTDLLDLSGLAAAVSGPQPVTIFAPRDSAFEAMPEEELQELRKPANKDRLIRLLNYHIIGGKLTTEEMRGAKVSTQATLNAGTTLSIDATGMDIKVNGTPIIEADDVDSTNGVIHEIGAVLIPPLN